jgi:hypothetical protein
VHESEARELFAPASSGEAQRQLVVVRAEEVDREGVGFAERRIARRRLRDAPQDEGRSSDTDENEFAVMPTGRSPERAVAMVTPVGNCPSARRKSSGVSLEACAGASAIALSCREKYSFSCNTVEQ